MIRAVLRWLRSQYNTDSARSFVIRAYRDKFLADDKKTKAVIDDLTVFCCMSDTTAPGSPIDPYQMAVYEGRRQVFLHIENMTRVTSAQIAPTKEVDTRDDPRPKPQPEPDTGTNTSPYWESIEPDTGTKPNSES